MFTLGGVEDDYMLPLVTRYHLPLYIHSVSNYEKLNELQLVADVCTTVTPKSGVWLSHQLRQTDVIVRTITPTSSAQAKPSHRRNFLAPPQNCLLMHLTHGSDDRNRREDTSYDAFRVYQEHYDFVLVDNTYWEAQLNLGRKEPLSRCIGNIPLASYMKERESLRESRDDIIRSHGLDPSLPTVVYAPTWDQPDRSPRLGNGTFTTHGKEICANVPTSCNLIIKLHPHIWRMNLDAVQACKESLAGRERVWLVETTVPFLALLDLGDIIISDHSVVCPTALALDKPLIVFDPTTDSLCDDWVVRFGDRASAAGDIKSLLDRMTVDRQWRARDRQRFMTEMGFLNERAVEDAFSTIQSVEVTPLSR
jgi:hypothetical protein